MIKEYGKLLAEWFCEEKRDFPWRVNRSIYSILVSEVMLQQTKACVVIPFFEKWMEKFPDFQSLSKSTEEEVVKAWEGLGYYSRARNLRNIAIEVEEKFGGIFPKELEKIKNFKGIGTYTAAAISHFAFNERVLGADGNIKKVLARFYGYLESIEKEKPLLELLDSFLPKQNSGDCFEGLIELGATICGKKPTCGLCPINDSCIAFQKGTTDLLPIRKKKEKVIPIYRVVYVFENQESVLVKKQENGLMKGLYEFPYIEVQKPISLSIAKKMGENYFHCCFKNMDVIGNFVHTFTKYKASLLAIKIALTEEIEIEGCIFVKQKLLLNYPFSSGHRKILRKILYI